MAWGKRSVGGLIGGLLLANVLAWGWAWALFHDLPVLLGTALLAYTLGLRHAVDADHIAAIDNVTRTLTRDGRQPVTVGLFFALGHSSVVFALSVLVAVTATAIQGRFQALHALGGVVGTSVSGVFLLIIAAANMAVLTAVVRAFRQVRRGEIPDVAVLDAGGAGGLMGRAFRLVRREWNMYPLGLLFGLGFDTATEIGLLGISAAQAADSLPLWSILVFPALFTAGMTLVDTVDGLIMVRACQWATRHPLRRLYYNMTITLISVVVAVLVGGIEVLGLLGRALNLEGMFWQMIAQLNDNFGLLGVAIIAMVVGSWILSVVIYRLKGYDSLDQGNPVGDV